MNTDELERQLYWAERRVREIQTKLHRWATSDPHRRFDDLYNLVCDPSFLLVAWDRVRGNTGARTAGVDGQTVHQVEVGQGVEGFLDGLRVEYKDGFGLARPSNTTPTIVLRFEAENAAALARIQSEFRQVLARAKPGAELPF